MSVACQKQYTLTVQTPIPVDAYWTMEEIGLATNRVDKVHSVALIPNAQTGIDASTGKIGNGLGFYERGDTLGSIFTTPNTTNLSITNNLGWSCCMWINVLTADSFSSGQQITWSDGFLQSFQIHGTNFLGNYRVDFQIGDANGNFFFPPNWFPVLGVWNFLHVFYDPVSQTVGWSINLGAPNVAVGPIPFFGEPNAAHFDIRDNFQNAPGGPGTLAVVIDEVAMKLTRIFTATELSSLYNGGAGRTWPL